MFDTSNILTGSYNPGFPGAANTLSGASPTASDVVVWDLDENANLHAYAASNLALLFSARGQSYSCSGNPTKFAVPVVAAGKLCHGCSNGMLCYSLM